MKSNIITIFFASILIFSCSKDEVKVDPLVIPTTYEATTFSANTTAEVALRADYVALENEIKKARVKGVVVEATTLNTLFSKSISGLSTTYYKTLVPTLNDKIAKASKANTAYLLGKTPSENGVGGIAGGYLFDEKGLDVEQVISKGLFGAFHYNQAVVLLASPTQANLDKALYYFGANPLFPNTNNATKTTSPDVYLANYAARRTKAVSGVYLDVKAGFIKAQAAIKAGSSYNKERDEAIEAILLNWEKANAATIINYFNDVYTKLSIVPSTDALKSGALHSFGEAIGFLGGFKGVSRKKITDAQIDELLAKMDNPSKLVGNQAEVDKILELSKSLQTIYGFSTQDLLDFKQNWITLEER
ncbi:hypothetical protein VB796_20800 [Arcicella sp. LKC2W]|uniref:hypothetical protein n=1 Tax=Arcicella sp. LKC2W TaxID=2984198 RepID=UPI002B1F3F19|nr:hypothetical protein [Arcicella sp. LKC2W]MEA5461518.1 hypothetical protein [Arcicella sp. LKC2W]